MEFKDHIKRYLRKAGASIFGKKPAIHRIPFGPLKGRRIFMSFDISPRMYFGIDEPWLAELALAYVKPGDVVYDIGAHIGYTCLLFAECVRNTGAVHAFEILPSVVDRYLKKTVTANNLNNIFIHNIGLSDREKTLELPVGETMMTSLIWAPEAQYNELGHTISLTEYVFRKHIPLPSLVKIDIEGAEIECLSGGIELIARCSPPMIVEFHSKDLLEKGLSLLMPLGYKLITQDGTVVDQRFFQGINRFHASVLCLPQSLVDMV